MPDGKQATPSLTFSAGQGRGENKTKEKLLGSDKGSLIQEKKMPVWNQRKTKDLFSTSYQLVISSLFLSFYCWTALSGIEYSFAAWVSSPGYVTSQDLTHPLPTGKGGMLERQPWCWVSTRWTPFSLPVKAAVGRITPSPADPVQLPRQNIRNRKFWIIYNIVRNYSLSPNVEFVYEQFCFPTV